MRYIGIVLVIASLPGFYLILTSQPQFRRWAYFALGFLPLLLSALNVDAAFYNLPRWLGYTDSISFSLLDTLALALIATHRNVLKNLPFVGPFLVYILAVAASTFFAEQFIPATFYVVQLMRVFIIFLAVAAVVKEPEAVKMICLGLACGAVYQGAMGIYQRLTGVFQVTGSFAHQNTLGFMLHFVTIPLLSLVMLKKQPAIYLWAIAAGTIAVSLSASRGSIAFVAMGVVLLFALSLIRQSTSRKYGIIGGVAVLAVVVSPIVVAGLDKRYETLDEGSYDERAAFESAATMMLQENPMGVGANQYPLAANLLGYSDRAGVIWAYGSRSANVHHMYLLMGAETGWGGMLSFSFLLFWIIVRGLAFSLRNRRDPIGDLVLGFTVTMIVIAIHGFYEWIFVTYEVQTIFAVALGIIAGSIRLANSGKVSTMLAEQRAAAGESGEGKETNGSTGAGAPGLAGASGLGRRGKVQPVLPLAAPQKPEKAKDHGIKGVMLSPPPSRSTK